MLLQLIMQHNSVSEPLRLRWLRSGLIAATEVISSLGRAYFFAVVFFATFLAGVFFASVLVAALVSTTFFVSVFFTVFVAILCPAFLGLIFWLVASILRSG